MTDPFAYGPRAARPAQLPPVWPPLDPETGLVDLSDDSDPPDGFFTDPDVVRRMDAATTVAQGLSPAEAMRDSNRKLSELTRAQWDFDVRRRAFEDAQAFSFADPADGREPVFAELSPEQATKVHAFTGDTGLQVDFPREYGGYFAAIRDPAEDREVGVVPRTMVLALADEVREAGTVESEAGPSASAADPDDEGFLERFLTKERVRDLVLDMVPVVGHYRAGRDAIESYAEALEAARRDDWKAFLQHGGLGLLNTLGAIPLPGTFTFLLAARAIRYLANATPGVRQAVAAHGLKKAASNIDKRFDPIQVDKAMGRTFRELTDEQKKKIEAIVPNAIGRAAEHHAINQLRILGQRVTEQGRKTTTTVNLGGKEVTRRHDAIIENVKRNVFMDFAGIFHPDARTVAVEVKAQASRYGRQRTVDRAVVADGSSIQQVRPLRFPIGSISEELLDRTTRKMLAKHVFDGPGGLSQKQVDQIVGKLMRLRRGHGDWVTAEVFAAIAARQTANVIAWDLEDRQRKGAENHGSAKSGLATVPSGRARRRRNGAENHGSAKSRTGTGTLRGPARRRRARGL